MPNPAFLRVPDNVFNFAPKKQFNFASIPFKQNTSDLSLSQFDKVVEIGDESGSKKGDESSSKYVYDS